MGETIKKLTIEGFRSIQKLDSFELRSLNIVIGANGAGKSNFVGFFRLFRELIEQRLQLAVTRAGGADTLLHLGPKVTKQILARIYFGNNGYEISLVPTADNRLVFLDESTVYFRANERFAKLLGSGNAESVLKDRRNDPGSMGAKHGPPYYVFEAASSWVVYHFHDTSEMAGVRRWGAISDNEYLRDDASNLAAFLYKLQRTDLNSYTRIRDVVRLAAPFFDDFKLRPVVDNAEMIQLEWTQKGSDYIFRPSQLSDGTLRFICLATALLQPSLPSTVLFDEPELGLHPYALALLAQLFKQAAREFYGYVTRQVVVSTQSVALLNEFAPEDVVVVERHEGQSSFRRLDPTQLGEWLQVYSLGELWQKNVLGGRPKGEFIAPASPPMAPHVSTNGGANPIG